MQMLVLDRGVTNTSLLLGLQKNDLFGLTLCVLMELLNAVFCVEATKANLPT